jgi:hypothetical protein
MRCIAQTLRAVAAGSDDAAHWDLALARKHGASSRRYLVSLALFLFFVGWLKCNRHTQATRKRWRCVCPICWLWHFRLPLLQVWVPFRTPFPTIPKRKRTHMHSGAIATTRHQAAATDCGALCRCGRPRLCRPFVLLSLSRTKRASILSTVQSHRPKCFNCVRISLLEQHAAQITASLRGCDL